MPAPRRLFVVGCPRSGTTWVRSLLAAHPRVSAAPVETAVFTLYLSRLTAAWNAETRRAEPDKGYGLRSLLEPSEFDRLLRGFADEVLAKAMPPREGVAWEVEKTPDHAEQAALILQLYPEASFLHVIRDPREVFCSFRGAGAWTRAFPDNPVAAARTWTHIVGQGVGIARLTPRYAEVRYERLLRDGAGELQRLFDWLQLEAPAGLSAEIVAAHDFETLRASHPNPAFFRRGAAEGWRNELTAGELRLLEQIAGPLMESLGYPRALPPGRIVPPRFWLRRRLERLRSALDRRLRGWIERL